MVGLNLKLTQREELKELNKNSYPRTKFKTNLIALVQEYAYSLLKNINGAVVVIDCGKTEV